MVNRQEEVRRVTAAMQRYEAAYDSLDAAAVKAVFPSQSDLSKVFAGYRSYDLEIAIQSIDISSDGTSATVVARVSHDFRGNVGGRQRVPPVSQTYTLQKQGSDWIIVQRR